MKIDGASSNHHFDIGNHPKRLRNQEGMENLMAQRMDINHRFAECRSLGHEWRKGKPVGTDDELDGFNRPFGASTGMVGIPSSCPNCGTQKVRWITRRGESITRYQHPNGYSRHGEERLTAQQWRKSYVATIFSEFTQARKGA